jgi:hypothetical protein
VKTAAMAPLTWKQHLMHGMWLVNKIIVTARAQNTDPFSHCLLLQLHRNASQHRATTSTAAGAPAVSQHPCLASGCYKEICQGHCSSPLCSSGSLPC